MAIDYSANLAVEEFDAMGYWRCSHRRRTKEEHLAMSVSDRFRIMATMTEGRRRVAAARLRRKRPAITDHAIKDMIVNHLLRRSDRENEIANRLHRKSSGKRNPAFTF